MNNPEFLTKKSDEEILGKELTKDLYSTETKSLIAKKGQKIDPLTLNRIKQYNLTHKALSQTR